LRRQTLADKQTFDLAFLAFVNPDRNLAFAVFLSPFKRSQV